MAIIVHPQDPGSYLAGFNFPCLAASIGTFKQSMSTAVKTPSVRAPDEPFYAQQTREAVFLRAQFVGLTSAEKTSNKVSFAYFDSLTV